MKKLSSITIFFIGFVSICSAQTVTIGTQIWMKENLDVDRFRNGDSIPQAKTAEEWKKAGENRQPAWCYFDNDPSNYESMNDMQSRGLNYGKLYNWYAVNDPRGLAPVGWHVPSLNEWKILFNYLGGADVAGKKMKSSEGWAAGGNGTNQSGFSAYPGGGRRNDGTFIISNSGRWWSSTEINKESALEIFLYRDSDAVTDGSGKTLGFSVRCLRD